MLLYFQKGGGHRNGMSQFTSPIQHIKRFNSFEIKSLVKHNIQGVNSSESG